MAYTPTTWVDSENKYNIVRNTDDVVTDSDIRLVYTGTGGTPLSAVNLNNIEDELVFLDTQYRLPDYSSIATTKLAVTPFTVGTLDAPMKYQIGGLSVSYLSYNVDVATSGTVTFESTLDNKYFDSLHNIILTGTGSTMTITNDTGGIADIGIIEMDTFGIETYTVNQMTDISNAMQTGIDIQSAIVDIKSVGKNLFDGILEVGTLSVVDGSESSDENRNRSKNFIAVKQNETYNINNYSGTIANILEYDYNKNYIGVVTYLGGTNPTGFTVSESARYVKFYSDTGAQLTGDIQLEQGTTATAYETYKQNLLQPNIELKSLPNGVKDELSNAVVDPADSNKLLRLDNAVHTKNVKEYTLQSDDFVSIADDNEIQKIEVNLPTDAKSGLGNTVGQLLVSGTSGETAFPYDTSDKIGLVYHTDYIFYFIVELGTYTTLQDAIDDLVTAKNTVIQYQLAEPIVNELSLDEIYSFENGVLYQNGIPVSIDYTTATNQSAVIKGIGDVVENLDDKVEQNETDIAVIESDITDLQDSVVIETGVTLSSASWTDDTATSGYWYYQVTDTAVDINTVVDFNPSISNDFGDNSILVSTESFDGYYRVYSLSEPTGDISATAKKVK